MFKKLTTKEKYQKYLKNAFAYETCNSQHGDKCSNGYCRKAILHLEDNAVAYFTCGKGEIVITPKCPYCRTRMNLISRNLVFSYWGCETCHKEFEIHIQTEQFTNEIDK